MTAEEAKVLEAAGKVVDRLRNMGGADESMYALDMKLCAAVDALRVARGNKP